MQLSHSPANSSLLQVKYTILLSALKKLWVWKGSDIQGWNEKEQAFQSIVLSWLQTCLLATITSFKVGPCWVDQNLILNSLQCFPYAKQKSLPRFYKPSWNRTAKECSYDTQKPLNEFKMRLRSTQQGQTLLSFVQCTSTVVYTAGRTTNNTWEIISHKAAVTELLC